MSFGYLVFDENGKVARVVVRCTCPGTPEISCTYAGQDVMGYQIFMAQCECKLKHRVVVMIPKPPEVIKSN